MMAIFLLKPPQKCPQRRARAREPRDQRWNMPRKTHFAYLVNYPRLRYSRAAAAKSAVRRRNLCNLKAAPLVACAVALAHPLQGLLQRRFCNVSMVTQAGQLSGWPVSFRTGIPTPVWVTTQERRNSGGSMIRYLKEAAKWLRSSSPLILFPAPAVYLSGCIMNELIPTPETPPDSWSLCDSCRLLADALVNPQNGNATPYLSLMMQTQLEHLDIALTMPIPEHRKTLPPMTDDGLFDNTELEPAELCDQCRALNYAFMMLSNKTVKEVIAFVLWERLDMLRRSLYAPSEGHDEN